MTLALLLTAVGGAWAQSTVQCSLDDITIEPGGSATTNFNLTNPDDKFCACQFTIQFPQGISIAYDTDEEEYVASLIRNRMKHHSLDVVYNSVYTVTVASNQDFQGTEGPLINFSIVADNNAVAGNYDCYITNVTLTKTEGDPVTFESIPFKVTISGSEPADGDNTIEVTTNAASEQDLFTEASFTMPAFDATADYELVRDLSVETQVTVGDDHDAQPRYRVQKQGNTFQPVGMTTAEVMALFRVHDQIEDEDLAPVQDYTVEIYAVDDDGEPVGEAMTFSTFTYAPGNYIAKALGQGNYVGTTEQSNVFTLYQGYEVTVAPGEYITYYQNEALTLDASETAAELYTISSVTANEAVLSSKLTVAPAETPMLVYNSSAEEKTFLLIPTTTDETVSVADEFKGTLIATTIPASTASQDNYALNGKAFVWVKYEISIAANKCWLQIGDQPAATRANTRSITGGGNTTGIKGTDFTDYTDGDYYDLNGRKVAKPNKKGIYIKNGQKVIIK